MEDDELQAIRAKRMAELQAQAGKSSVMNIFFHFYVSTTRKPKLKQEYEKKKKNLVN